MAHLVEGTPDAFTIRRVYVRRYSDTGQVVAYVDWANGGRTEGSPKYQANHRQPYTVHFGVHMHSLFQRAKRDGLKLERETW